MGELLPHGKYSRQTQRTGRLGSQPVEILHLARLEETGTEKEKPYPAGSKTGNGQIMEPDADGGLGNRPKPDSGHYHYPEKADEKGLSICTRFIPENFPTV